MQKILFALALAVAAAVGLGLGIAQFSGSSTPPTDVASNGMEGGQEAEEAEAPQPNFPVGDVLALADLPGDPEAGARIFRRCQSCHMAGDNAQNRTGPILNGVFGRPAAGLDSYPRYSAAMAEAGRTGLVWGTETLRPYLISPRSYVEGTNMNYAGVTDPGDLDDLIAYLAQFSDPVVTGNRR